MYLKHITKTCKVISSCFTFSPCNFDLCKNIYRQNLINYCIGSLEGIYLNNDERFWWYFKTTVWEKMSAVEIEIKDFNCDNYIHCSFG